jgi:cytochrome c-type biogenesis protein CcmF
LDTIFLNEHLIPGQIGELFTLLSFVAALIATISYSFAAQSKDLTQQKSWSVLGRSSFIVHSLSVFGIFATLFYLIFNHYFEYHYVWAHSSRALPFKYLLSCFWEGQEGSFLLWTTWHCILSMFIITKRNKWEAPVMATVSLVQVFLASMLLGIYVLGEKIGSNPFILLRDQMAGAPIFQQPNYLESITDGNGLNPLLQNYWMVIHPPVLFLGFAATLFPFAYVIAVLWKNEYTDFIPGMLRWSVFTGMVLGTGIMMGGAWAYESLNFGGYWAWDPVENASLVPWIVMIAGMHTLMIYKATGYSLKSTFLFFILSFILVLYSTFLTRTGILGETSVHAFTGEGGSLFYHLLVFMFLLLLIGLVLFFIRFKSIPDLKKEEEALGSREFWMFIGALVLMISVVQITYTTSMPVWNQLFGTKLTITDPITHYNKIQIWITLLVLLGTAIIHYLKFKQTSFRDVVKKLWPPVLLSAICSALIIYLQEITSVPVAVLMAAAVLSTFTNLFYLIRVIRWNAIKWGGSTAHVGFSLMIVGIILSSFNKQVISVNRLGVDLPMGKKTEEENRKESRENLLLFRNMPVTMAGYTLTYLGDTVIEPNHYYRVRYQTRINDTGAIKEEFILEPNAQINPKMGLVSSPDTKHYLTHDVFTYITSTVDKDQIKDTVSYTAQKMRKGDTAYFNTGFMIFDGFNANNIEQPNYTAQSGDIAVAANLKVYNMEGNALTAQPVYVIRNQQEEIIPDTLKLFNLYTRLTKILPNENAAMIEFKQPSAMNDYIIMKAILFPYINVLWLGTVLMIVGFGISLYKRIFSK